MTAEFPPLNLPPQKQQDLTQIKLSSVLIDQQYCICGILLKPLSLGHVILLEALHNPLVSPEVEDVEQSEGICFFFLALIICSLSYEDGLALLNDTQGLDEISKRFIDNLLLNIKKEPGWNIYSKLALFKQYMSNFLDSMPYYDHLNKQENISSGADWKTGILITFKKLGYKDTEILNMSMKQLFNIWANYSESEGQIKIANKYQAKQLETLQQFKRNS